MSKKSLWTIIIIAIIIIIGIVVAANRSSQPTTSASHESINPDSMGTGTTATSTSDRSKTYTLADVQTHASATDCWTTISGNVYDLTPFVNSHPGGVENITKVCGIDGTSLFDKQHGDSRKPNNQLEKLKIGILTQ